MTAIDRAARVAIRRTSEFGWAKKPSKLSYLVEFQSSEANDIGMVSFLNPGTTESVAGGVIPAKGMNLHRLQWNTILIKI